MSLMDQALNIPKLINPATQWAMNYLNSGVQGFQNPPKQYIGQDSLQNTLDMVPGRSNIRGMMQGLFGQQAIASPIMAIGADNDPAKLADQQFGQTLRNSGDAWASNKLPMTPQERWIPNPNNPNQLIDRFAVKTSVQPLDFQQLINNARKLIRK